jgi:hypothetical protein
MSDSADYYASMFVKASKKTGVDPRIPLVLMLRESCFKRDALNRSSGAFGMGGLMPATAKRVCDTVNSRYSMKLGCNAREYRKPWVATLLTFVAVDILKKHYKSELHVFAAYTGRNPAKGARLDGNQMRRAAAINGTLMTVKSAERKMF